MPKATPVTAYATDGTTGRSVRLGRDRSRGMGRPAKARSSSRGGGAAQGGHDAVCTVVVRFKMKSDVLDFAAGGALLEPLECPDFKGKSNSMDLQWDINFGKFQTRVSDW